MKDKKISDYTLEDVAELTDAEVLAMSMPRPGHPGQGGFIFPKEAKPEAMAALIKRLSQIRAKEGSLFNTLDQLLTAILKNSTQKERDQLSKTLEKWKIRTLAVDALQEAKDEQEAQLKPFIAFIKGENGFAFESYLVNPTDTHYSRVVSLTGALASDDDGVLETSKAVRERGQLPARFAIPIELDDTIGGLDFLIWYNLDLYERLNPYPAPETNSEPWMVQFSFPKYDYKSEAEPLPIIGRKGMRVELQPRKSGKVVQEEAKGMDMQGGYYKDGKKQY